MLFFDVEDVGGDEFDERVVDGGEIFVDVCGDVVG